MTRVPMSPRPVWPVLVVAAAWVVFTVLVPGTIGLTVIQLWGSSGAAPRSDVLLAASLSGIASALTGLIVAVTVRARSDDESAASLTVLTAVCAGIDLLLFAGMLIAAVTRTA